MYSQNGTNVGLGRDSHYRVSRKQLKSFSSAKVIDLNTNNNTATTNSDGKPEAATAVVVAPHDGHEDARNMLSCI
jgi:hypothetical protein